MASLPEQELPASKPVVALASAGIILVVYGGLGFLGLKLAKKLGFPSILDPDVSRRQRFMIPAYVGVATGVFIILADLFFKRLHPFGALPHPPFPTSIVVSVSAAIGEEVIFRLFFIPFWVWLISSVLLRGKWQRQVFWAVAALSALAFALGHLPSLMLVLGLNTISRVPAALLAEIVLLNGLLSILAAALFKRYGFLAAVGVHFWADVVWHVVWGLLR
jgi:membrane protease YdiL (CAAX protease family)